MSSQVKLIITVGDSYQTTRNKLNLSGPSQGFQNIANWLQQIAAGTISAHARLETGTGVANNMITFASFVENDKVTLNGVDLTGKDSPTGSQEFAVGSDDFDCANNFVAKVNALSLSSAISKIFNSVYAYRRATIAFSSFVTTDYVTINGIVFTGKTTPANEFEFAIGGSDTVTCQNFVNAVNKIKAKVPNLKDIRTLTDSSGTATILCDGSLTAAISAHGTVAAKFVVLESLQIGGCGNLMTLAISAHGSVTGANFANGSDGAMVDLKKGLPV